MVVGFTRDRGEGLGVEGSTPFLAIYDVPIVIQHMPIDAPLMFLYNLMNHVSPQHCP
jgi:hypothetical protein